MQHEFFSITLFLSFAGNDWYNYKTKQIIQSMKRLVPLPNQPLIEHPFWFKMIYESAYKYIFIYS